MGARFQNWLNRNIWDFSEKRSGTISLENPQHTLNGFTLDQIFGGNTSLTGKSVSFDNSLTLSAYYRALAIKSGVLSSLPVKVYKKTDKGRIELKPSDHPVAKLLRKPDKVYSKSTYFERSSIHYDSWGNHVAIINTNRIGTVEGLILINPKDVDPIQKGQSVVYKIKDHGTLSSEDVIHVPNLGEGIWGKSVIRCAMEDFALQMMTRDHGSKFYANDGRPSGIFSPKAPLTDAQRSQKKDSWDKAKSKGGDIVAPYGIDYTPISIPPDEYAFLASNSFGITTISRWTGVPPEKLGDHTNASYNNFEHSGIGFLQDTEVPIVNKFEDEYTAKLFPTMGEEDLYIEFTVEAYLRADMKTKSELFSTYVQNGLKTPDEIRALNNDPEMGGNAGKLFMQSGTMPIDLINKLLERTPAQSRKSLRMKIEKQVKEGIDPQLIIEGIYNSNGNGKH